IVVPDSLRRLTRALNAFAPVGASFFNEPHHGLPSLCLEDDFGLPGPVVLDTEQFSRMLETELEAAGMPFVTVDGDLIGEAVRRGSWTVVLCPGCLEAEIAQEIASALASGKAVSVGPYFPDRDANLQPVDRAPFSPHQIGGNVPALLGMGRPGLR